MHYYYHENTVYFDNAQLVKEISESYTYDKDGNLTAVSAGEGEDSAFVYNNKHDLTSVKDAEDNISRDFDICMYCGYCNNKGI